MGTPGSRPERWRRRRRAAVAVALPLRLQGRHGAACSRPRTSAGSPPDRDVRRGHPPWRRYERACDFLEDDLESATSASSGDDRRGWSTPEIGAAAREVLTGWYDLLADVATEAASTFGGLGPFSSAEVAALIVNTFMGAEALLLLGFDRHQMPIRASLRRIGELIRAAEERSAGDGHPVQAAAGR